MNVCSMWRAVALMPTALILQAPILASVTAVLLGTGLVRPITRILCGGWGGGGANETKVDQTTEMYFLLSDPFI